MLAPADVAELRDLVEELAFPDQYAVLRAGGTAKDTRGNPKPTETTVETGWCALRGNRLTPREQTYAAQLGTRVAYAIDLPVATVVTAKDRIRVGGTRTFEVLGVLREGALAMLATAFCEEAG